MSVLQPISYGLVHQIGPGTGARGFGSYKADNTELIRPYQQEASSPIGRGYPMGIVSGRPTVYDPRAGIKEDPVVVLLKKILGMKTVVEKAPDAGFMKNDQVYVGSDSGIGGGGGGDVVVGDASTDYGSLNEFKSELARLSAPTEYMSVQSWLDNIPDILEKVDFEGREIGTQTSGAFGDDDPAIDYLLDQLDALQMLYEGVVHAREGDLKRYRSALEYYAAMAEAAGVSSYERVLYILERHGIEEVKELKKEILEAFNKLVRDKAGELTMKQVKDNSTQLTLDAINRHPPQSNLSGIARYRAPRNRGLRINTDVPRAARKSGEQFYPSERTQKVESGKSMNESIPLRRPRRR